MEGGHSPETPLKEPLKSRVMKTVRNTVAGLGIGSVRNPTVDIRTTHTVVLDDKGEITNRHETKQYFDSETGRELDPHNPQELKIIKERPKAE